MPEVLVVTDTEAGSTFLTQQREVHAPVAAFSPGFDSPYREVSPNTTASSCFFVLHGVGFFCGCFVILAPSYPLQNRYSFFEMIDI